MIIDSSKDYSTGIVLLTFDGETPTKAEIDEYTYAYFGMTGEVSIEPPSEWSGFQNPGVIYVTPISL